ncbi:hypothetical protein H7U37_13795 [Pseudoflavonifractor phocaeensis]|uniref:hypothetical protein n=1 Tax=Pseudoflavonifractor phocaeensis TaxID=1870988 RepID=UPI00195F1880|nr:hypothetical protein [Pseudoflavonifractor phocaeensis]MBM6939580.1 hypothetical protein [Pseudoflavonifractor phocaeensis]
MRFFVRRLGVLCYRLLGVAAAVILFLTAAQLFAHRHAQFYPDYPMTDLSAIPEQDRLSEEDYETLFLQTGLGKAGVDDLLSLGQPGKDQILDTQTAFFAKTATDCGSLGITTREDHVVDGDGNITYACPMAPVEEGDVFLSFSTHTLGWRHGHAGVVVDAANGRTLEAVLIGYDAATASVSHWSCYSTFLHLRVKDITPEEQEAIADYAMAHLDGVPYHLTSGVLGPDKVQDPDADSFGAQCAYLVWYALYQGAGYDTDSDGGRIVTVGDLAESPLFEIVQVYGLDPRSFG